MATLLPILLLLVTSMLSTSDSDPAQKVTLSMYYETLCPSCSSFTANQLENIFSNGLISIVDLRFVPFGNAKILDDGSIDCQVS